MLFRSEGKTHIYIIICNSVENIAHAQCTVVILFDFPSFLLQISSKKKPLFESEQYLNNSVGNHTQTKSFNHKSSLIVPKQDHRFTHLVPKTRSYLSLKSIPRGLSVCQTPNHVTTTFPISAECLCIPCDFLSFERNKFEMLKCRMCYNVTSANKVFGDIS